MRSIVFRLLAVVASTQAGTASAEVVGPLAVTETSRPYLAASDLAGTGYIEEEFLLSGEAAVHGWGPDGRARAETLPAPYVTRLLVRRPADPKRFSGNVEVEVLNATRSADAAFTWPTSRDFIVARGDVWIGISSKPVAARALQAGDAARYVQLSWRNPRARGETCDEPSSIPGYMSPSSATRRVPTSFPESEDGLFWDMFAQLGTALKGEERQHLLPGFRAPKLFATGISQSGNMLRTWINGFHAARRLPGGGPIYDGYLIEVGPALYKINQCETPEIPPEDPRNRVAAIDVPVVNLLSEGDLWLGKLTRQPDRILRRSGIVTYEVAGGSHGGGAFAKPGTAPALLDAAMLAAGAPAGALQNDFHRLPLSRAALRNLQDWANRGVAPPPGRVVMLDADKSIRRDADGNALGGVRLPYIEAPLASYRGSIGSAGLLALTGAKVPFNPERLRALYPTKEAWLARFDASTDRLLAERRILPEDAAALKAEARGMAF